MTPPTKPARVKRQKTKPVGEKGRTLEEHSDDRKREALVAYVEMGKFNLAADATGIPWQNIQRWARDPRWADELGAIKHAHAREVRARFAGGAADFADGIAKFKASLMADLERGDLKPKEKAAALRALSASSVDVARIGDIIEGQAVVSITPTHFSVSLEVGPES